jgi:hypothetical protein
VTGDDDGTFDHGRVHRGPPDSELVTGRSSISVIARS